MKEIELKGVVADLEAMLHRLESLGARRVYVGRLEDRRLDDAAGSLRARDEMLRVRCYREGGSVVSASVDWKGPVNIASGYKEREEINAPAPDPALMLEVLGRAGFRTTVAIDRVIWQYELDGVTIRLERYPRMDDLVEIEGEADAMERVIERLELNRATLGADSIFAFARRFELRMGVAALLATGDDAAHTGPSNA